MAQSRLHQCATTAGYGCRYSADRRTIENPSSACATGEGGRLLHPKPLEDAGDAEAGSWLPRPAYRRFGCRIARSRRRWNPGDYADVRQGADRRNRAAHGGRCKAAGYSQPVPAGSNVSVTGRVAGWDGIWRGWGNFYRIRHNLDDRRTGEHNTCILGHGDHNGAGVRRLSCPQSLFAAANPGAVGGIMNAREETNISRPGSNTRVLV